MSALIAIIHFDDTPIDADLLARMVDRIRYHGPAAQRQHIDGQIGFGHALQPTTPETYSEQQPVVVEGITLVANARLDARADLVAALRSAGRRAELTDPDSGLIAQAYLAWGEACLERLLGDFAFVIWDSRTRIAFAARDPMGLRRLFYARIANGLLISTEISALLLHPSVSAEPDETAIGDFLLLGRVSRYDKTLTAFADIHRLANAHKLIASAEHFSITRYWSMPVDQPLLHYPRLKDYVEHYRELLKLALKDRLRVSSALFSMSGGLDSPALVALTKHLVDAGELNLHIEIVTSVYDRIHPDNEAYYAGLVSRSLNLSHHILPVDEYLFVPPLADVIEPGEILQPGVDRAVRKRFAEMAVVGVYGQGSDEGLFDEPLIDVLGKLPFADAVRLYRELWRVNGKRPALGGVARWLRQRGQPPIAAYKRPTWLNPDYEQRLHLRERYDALWRWQPSPVHPRRPTVHKYLTFPDWSPEGEYFHRLDFTPLPVMMPFLDLRLIDFLLSMPPQPLFKRKGLIRRALQGYLPAELLTRPKMPLGTLSHTLISHSAAAWVDDWQPQPELARFVQRDAIPLLRRSPESIMENHTALRAVFLNRWLECVSHLPAYQQQPDREIF